MLVKLERGEVASPFVLDGTLVVTTVLLGGTLRI